MNKILTLPKKVNQTIKVSGKLVYDPAREDFRKTNKQRTLVLELPWDDLDIYYQWFLTKKYGPKSALQRPMYGKHVTVVKGNESVPNKDLWKKHADREIEIEYTPFVRKTFQFWSLPVKSAELEEIRRELGLTQPIEFHITIGRLFNWQIEAKASYDYKKENCAVL